jgi:hypothetical protein
MAINLLWESKMKIRTLGIALMLGFSAAVPGLASAEETLARETREVAAQTAPLVVRGHVVALEVATQTMIVRGEQGNEFRVPAMKLADGSQLAPGDAVALVYRNAMGVETEKSAMVGDGIRARADSTSFAPMGAGYDVVKQAEINATIDRMDAKTHELTLRGVHDPRTVAMSPEVDLKQFKPGDRVHAVIVTNYVVQPVRG